MEQPKFTLNSLLIVVTSFTAIMLVVTLTLVGVSDWSAVNDYYPIEGTDLGILYSDEKPCGIYQGSYANTSTLMLEGYYSHGWGVVHDGDRLFLNEYRTTDLGLMTSRLIRVDLNTFETEVLIPNAILRGACRSGELVCVCGSMLPSNFPDTNALCQLYGMAPSMLLSGPSTSIVFVDPHSGEVVYSLTGEDANMDDFEARYLDHTLEEIR